MKQPVVRRMSIALAIALCAARPAASQIQTAGRRVTIGEGSGYLEYPDAQKTLGLRPGDTLRIAPGTYSGLSLGHLSGAAGRPITVKCDPRARFTTSSHRPNRFPDIAHVRFEDFRYEEYNSQCMEITGASHDLLFKNFLIKDASGYSFRVYDAKKVFDGTRDSAFYNFTWEDCVFDGKVNGASICNEDYQPVSTMVSVLLDFEVFRCTFENFDNTKAAFPAIGVSRCFNLRVHECTFSNLGMAESPIGHNVCICGSGYFVVSRNRFTRQWANDVRMFPMKLNALGYDGKDAVTRFYNNISWEKRKYPVFEQNRVPQEQLDATPYLSRTASEIFFNTLYRSRKAASSGDPYVGQLVDVYAPDVTIKHNLIIEPEADAPFDPARNYVYALGSGPQPGIVVENNLVFRTLKESGLIDAASFVPSLESPVRDAAGGRVDYITTDHRGLPRYVGSAADVGAVERQEIER